MLVCECSIRKAWWLKCWCSLRIQTVVVSVSWVCLLLYNNLFMYNILYYFGLGLVWFGLGLRCAVGFGAVSDRWVLCVIAGLKAWRLNTKKGAPNKLAVTYKTQNCWRSLRIQTVVVSVFGLGLLCGVWCYAWLVRAVRDCWVWAVSCLLCIGLGLAVGFDAYILNYKL